jgi:hypothetical protein
LRSSEKKDILCLKKTTTLCRRLRRNGKSKLPLYQNLADAISHGLSVDLNRLGIIQEDIEELDQILRREPLNSNVSKLSAIKLRRKSETH